MLLILIPIILAIVLFFFVITFRNVPFLTAVAVRSDNSVCPEICRSYLGNTTKCSNYRHRCNCTSFRPEIRDILVCPGTNIVGCRQPIKPEDCWREVIYVDSSLSRDTVCSEMMQIIIDLTILRNSEQIYNGQSTMSLGCGGVTYTSAQFPWAIKEPGCYTIHAKVFDMAGNLLNERNIGKCIWE